MRVFLMLTGVALAAGATLVWLYLNDLASGWYTGGTKHSIKWLAREALYYFWLPVAAGTALVVLGWTRR